MYLVPDPYGWVDLRKGLLENEPASQVRSPPGAPMMVAEAVSPMTGSVARSAVITGAATFSAREAVSTVAPAAVILCKALQANCELSRLQFVAAHRHNRLRVVTT